MRVSQMLNDLRKTLVFILGILFVGLAFSGCGTIEYYGQAIQGQYQIFANQRPISDIAFDSQSSDSLRQKLSFILDVRQFAESELHLPVGNNYFHYVDIKRPYAVWTISATPEFSLTPHTWRYPVVGRASYRGYFSEKKARQYARELSGRGLDVHVGGVSAYSTLGWFDDPVLSSFLRYPDASMAGLIFHELAHRILYIKGDTAFNEGFASFVEQEGLRKWQPFPELFDGNHDYAMKSIRRREFNEMVMNCRYKLESLYQSPIPDEEKRKKKAAIFSDLQEEFNRRKAADADWSVYDNWMNTSLNNAKISGVVAYHDFVPAFRQILAENEGDLKQFYDACRKLSQTEKSKRHRILRAYTEKDVDPAETRTEL